MIGISYIQSMLPINYSYTNLDIKFKKPIFLE